MTVKFKVGDIVKFFEGPDLSYFIVTYIGEYAVHGKRIVQGRISNQISLLPLQAKKCTQKEKVHILEEVLACSKKEIS